MKVEPRPSSLSTVMSPVGQGGQQQGTERDTISREATQCCSPNCISSVAAQILFPALQPKLYFQ